MAGIRKDFMVYDFSQKEAVMVGETHEIVVDPNTRIPSIAVYLSVSDMINLDSDQSLSNSLSQGMLTPASLASDNSLTTDSSQVPSPVSQPESASNVPAPPTPEIVFVQEKVKIEERKKRKAPRLKPQDANLFRIDLRTNKMTDVGKRKKELLEESKLGRRYNYANNKSVTLFIDPSEPKTKKVEKEEVDTQSLTR